MIGSSHVDPARTALRCLRAVLLALVLGLLPGAVASRAQPSPMMERLRQTQALAFGLQFIDFAYDGASEPDVLFDFRNPAFGLAYHRSNIAGTVALGFQEGDGTARRPDLRLFDAALMTWGEWVPLDRLARPRVQAFVPVVLHSTYRRVDERNTEDGFENTYAVTVLGLGAGAGLHARPTRRAVLSVQATPAFGMATRAFDSGLGSSWLVNVEAGVYVGPVAGRFGLVLGYRYRRQVWNVGASGLLEGVADDLFDYRGRYHLVRLGLTW
ncbi:MAG: hypothetical protein D6685_10750 [Bacteroidetes bacterium]|nr:MAG: hypothetical protein D6685_10750 [Bacteroidota bacterium]